MRDTLQDKVLSKAVWFMKDLADGCVSMVVLLVDLVFIC